MVEPALQAPERHGRAAQDFELQKLQIEAERLVRIASAEAAASLFSKLEAKLLGTPGEVTQLLESLVSGQSAAQLANGFLEAAGEETPRHAQSLRHPYRPARGRSERAPRRHHRG